MFTLCSIEKKEENIRIWRHTLRQDKDNKNKQKTEMSAENTASFPALTIDWDLYGRYLEKSNLPEDQKREFIETLWSIMITFVDFGFGIEPVQTALKSEDKKLPNMVTPYLEFIKKPSLDDNFIAAMKNKTNNKETLEEGIKNEI